MKKEIIFTAVALMFLSSFGFSQSATVTCGGDSYEGNGSFSYSLGQVFYNVLGYNLTVTEGVQQPYEISEYIEDDEGKFGNEDIMNIALSAFPNPAKNYLYLTVGNDGDDLSDIAMEYAMFDVDGRIIMQDKISVGDNLLFVEALQPATYFVRIMIDGKRVKTFKVIKN